MVDGHQHSPVSAILASVERSQSARFLQVARASKKEELQKSELYSLLFGKWLILLRAKSGGEKYKKSFSREGRTQFCFLQPLLYCILYRTFSFSCSSLNQSLNTLEDFTFFGERHVNHPISFGKSFGWILILAFYGLHILLLLSLIDTRYFVTLVHTFLINTSGFVISNTHLQSHTDLLLGSAVTPVLRGGLFPFPPLIHWFSP